MHLLARCSEGRFYLPWLMRRFRAAGGRVLPRRVRSVEELAGFDAVVNCTGAQTCVMQAVLLPAECTGKCLLCVSPTRPSALLLPALIQPARSLA